MMYHVVELAALLSVAFFLGAVLGSLFHRTLAISPAMRPQRWAIARVDNVADRLELWIRRGKGPVPPTLAAEFVPVAVPLPTPAFDDQAFLPGIRLGSDAIIEHESPPGPEPLVRPFAVEPVPEPPAPRSKRYREAIARANAAGYRPLPLKAPRRGHADDLTRIRRMGKRNAAKLADLGIYHFSQIAAWTPQELAWIAAFLNMGDVPQAEDWPAQATRLASSEAFPMLRPAAEAPASFESGD